ncbi:YceD family protein [Oxalobacter paraformigenes]|uniref:Large ribosomal RNA subunit accumulation protein YceD n=1 Tax=Oxalobacter paraformigenes TaxID=556268 RepID=C3X725_9BURK|nr:YceD family protein [Oxalobacter paraformigenes]EEO26938.1 hypothetical protein OFAG_00091 [Oxalobacter paraformigenes]
MNSCLIDPFEFCKNNEILEGHIPVSELKRLVSVCADQSGELAWKVSGSLNSHQKPQLLLKVAGHINLVCQRCLDSLAFDLDSTTAVMVAQTEEEADEIEASLDDEEAVEVVVTDGKVEVMDLVEDEALLALPLSARHDVCPDSSLEGQKEKRESPFSVLSELKRKR